MADGYLAKKNLGKHDALIAHELFRAVVAVFPEKFTVYNDEGYRLSVARFSLNLNQFDSTSIKDVFSEIKVGTAYMP